MTTRGRYPLRLMETFRSVFYTPIHAALAGGFLEREGLDVTFETCKPPFAHTLTALVQGAADIVQSGVSRSILARDAGAETVPLHIAKINARDGFFVLGRDEKAAFRWEALRGARVIPVGFSPLPWATFQWALRQHGINPAELKLLPDLPLVDAVAAYRRGEADYIHLPDPAAEQLISEGVAQRVIALGPENGHIAYSSFVATHRFLHERTEVAQRFVQGFAHTLRWLQVNDAPTIGAAIAPFFPAVPGERLTRCVARYKEQDTWPAHPMLAEPEYESLQRILMSAGMVKEHQPYNEVVRPEFAQAVA